MRLACLLLLAAVAILQGQTTQGLISGRITDRGGSPVANAEIVGESLETSTRATGRSDGDGLFALLLLPPGRYRVRVEAGGYQPQEIHELELQVAAFLDLPFALRPIQDVWEARQYQRLILPGQNRVLKFYGPDLDLSRTVNIEAPRSSGGRLESTISAVIRPLEIRDLPLSGRDVYTALVLQPGVAADTSTARGVGVSVNGQRPSSSHFLLDGLENNNQLITGPLAVVAPEAVQEFRISTNNFSAEYGWTTGYLANAVTKAGGNRWHGLGYFNLKNDALNANDFSRNAAQKPRSPLKENQTGFQVGGPLIAERLFQSASFDFLRSRGRDEPTSFYLPTPTFLDQLKNFPQTSQARKLFAQFALPILGTPDRFDPNLALATVAPPIALNRSVALERIDYVSRGGSERLMGRLALARLARPDFIWSPYPDFSSPLDQNTTALGISVVSILRPALTNELRGGVSSDLLEFDRAHPELPTLIANQGSRSVYLPGSLAAYSYRNHSRSFELVDNLAWSRGRHVFKFGGGMLLRNLDGYLTFAQAGEYLFGPFVLFTIDQPLEAFVGVSRQKAAQSKALASPDYGREYRVNQFHAYAQDSIRVSERFSLNVGVRLERAGVPVNTGSVKDAVVSLGPGASLAEALAGARMQYPGPGDQELYSARRNAWGGRLGATYVPGWAGGIVFRGAFGIFYDRPFDNLWQNLRNNNVGLGRFTPADQVVYLDPVSKVLAGLPFTNIDDNSSRLTLYQPQIRSPRASIYFVGAERLFGALSVEVNASGAYGRGLITTDVVNRSFSRAGIVNAFSSRYQPDLQQIYYRANQGASSYDALAIRARYQGRRAQWQASYTWSHSIDNQSEPLFGDYFNLSFTKATSTGPQSGFVRQFDSSADRGNSDFDQRHSLVFYGLWAPPRVFAGKRAGVIVNDWKLGAIGAIRSGLPYTVTGGASSFAPLLSNRASLTVAAAKAEIDQPANGGVRLLDKTAFVSGGSALGNTGRNGFGGPGFFSTDISISRGFQVRRLGEAGRLTVRADAYNVLNHANLGNPDGVLGSPTFGLATYGRQETTSGFPALSPLRETARQVQLLFRIEF